MVGGPLGGLIGGVVGAVAPDILNSLIGASGAEEELDSLGNPRPMATGGIVTKPINAIIGEAGPEAVIPLDQYNNRGSDQTLVNEIKEMKNILSQILNRTGDVILDGNKVGQALVLSNYRMQ